jgi:hypothetical protein
VRKERYIRCSYNRNVPSPIPMEEGKGEGAFIACGRA